MEKIKDTKYGIEEDGTVWRLEGRVNQWGQTPPHVVQWGDNGNGYKVVNAGKVCYVHRLVAEHYIPNPEGHRYVGHKDHDKENNHKDNLYWASASRNTRDGVEAGKINYHGRYNGPMQHHPDEVLTKAYKDVRMGAEIQSTANKYGINRTTLSSWVNKRSRVALTDEIDKELLTTTQPDVTL